MLKIKLSDLNYRYDVYQMVNLFLDFENFQIVEKEEDIYIELLEKGLSIIKKGDIIFEYCYSLDFTKKENVKKGVLSYFKSNMDNSNKAPWGTLVGIRPTKAAISMLEKHETEDEIYSFYKHHYDCSNEKIKLCIDIAKHEIEFLNKDKNKISVYIDMPFCPSKCLYCSFTSEPINKTKGLVKEYLKALTYEIVCLNDFVKNSNITIETVYFGGGTPTSICDDDFKDIMDQIWINLIKDKNVAEFTVECGRPETISEEKLKIMKSTEVSRISINPQTMNDDTLKLVGRGHSTKDIIDKFRLARKFGFDNINMDIIIGLVGENHNYIEKTCEEILKLNPDSITVHGLSIKSASRLHENMLNKKSNRVITEDEEIAKMFLLTEELAEKLNMKPYYMYRQKNTFGNRENIGYCKKGKESIYNIQMIEDRQTIAALGADSVSKVVFFENGRIERFMSVKDVKIYINRLKDTVDKKLALLSTIL